MKRYALFLLLLLGLLAVGEGGRYLWIKVDPTTGERVLSNGKPLPANLAKIAVPGQFLEAEYGRLSPARQWRPPMDITKTFTPKDASRVVFSHERHFAALGAKGAACETCHKTLDAQKSWPSRAPNPALEPHGEKSLGRFCATCHDGKTRASNVKGAHPPVDVRIFSTFGAKGDRGCQRCHVPKDHGADFTSRHGDAAEGGGRLRCATCHRGARAIAPQEIKQVRKFFDAQIQLLKNPENDAAFNMTLPNNFCAYCHSVDLRAWYGE